MFKLFKKNNDAVKELEKRIKNLESIVLQLTKQNLGLTKSLVNLQGCIDEFIKISETVLENKKQYYKLVKIVNDVVKKVNIEIDPSDTLLIDVNKKNDNLPN